MAGNLNEELPGLKDVTGAYRFLNNKGLLRQNKYCESCQHPLRKKKSTQFPTCEALTCENEECVKLSVEIECLKGSFFNHGMSMNLPRQLRCIKYWSDKEPSNNVKRDLGIGQNTALEFYKKCQVFISNYFRSNPIELGGDGVVIAISIHKLFHMHSDQRSHLLMMVDTFKKTKENLMGYMEILDPENFGPNIFLTVFPIIKRVLKPSSVVAFDGEISPLQVNEKNFKFITCTLNENNALNSYYNSHSEAITNIINTNDQIKSELLLKECLWRERFGDDAFGNFLKHLKQYYNPSEPLSVKFNN